MSYIIVMIVGNDGDESERSLRECMDSYINFDCHQGAFVGNWDGREKLLNQTCEARNDINSHYNCIQSKCIQINFFVCANCVAEKWKSLR